jgi:photosystem II stability/assembly factor-like uncharacterized protein
LIVVLVLRADDTTASQTTATVGGDLHTITSIGDALYVGGHQAVAVSRDNGATWQQISSLNDADAMGWAVTNDAVLVGGHPGLYRSTDNGGTFTQVTDAAAVPDVHALGGTGNTVYLGSPQVGLLASTDGGRNWQVRNPQAGRSFMGTILVDPKNPNRLIAPDMAGSLTMSTDGGRTFTSLGGPMGAMAATWNPADTREIIAIGMNGAARSNNGGGSWQDIAVPEDTSAVTYAAQDSTIYAAALKGRQAVTYRSTDAGATWQSTS